MNDSINGSLSVLPPSYTTAEIWLQNVAFYAFGCGVLGTTVNALVVSAIRKDTQLRSRFFIIVAFLSMCRLLLSVNIGIIGIQRSLRQVGIMSLQQKRFVCSSMHVWYMNGLTLELTLILLMVIDRVIALVSPATYNKMSDGQAVYICGILYALSILIKTVPGFLWAVNPVEVIQCINVFSAASDICSNYSRYLDVFLGAAIIFLYIGLMVHIQLHVRHKLANEISEAAKASLQRQLGLMPMLRNQVLLHSGLSLTSKALLLSGAIFPSQEARLSAWGGNFIVIDVLVNTTVILFGNKDIKASALEVLKLKKSAVITPFASSTSGHTQGGTVNRGICTKC